MALNVPPAVYVIPMDSKNEEFPNWSIDDVQRRFFLCELPWDPCPGRYRYRERLNPRISASRRHDARDASWEFKNLGARSHCEAPILSGISVEDSNS